MPPGPLGFPFVQSENIDFSIIKVVFVRNKQELIPSSQAHVLLLPCDGPTSPRHNSITCMTSGELPDFIETQFLYKLG